MGKPTKIMHGLNFGGLAHKGPKMARLKLLTGGYPKMAPAVFEVRGITRDGPVLAQQSSKREASPQNGASPQNAHTGPQKDCLLGYPKFL